MSVHGEFSRSLEMMIDRLRSLEHAERDRWLERLKAARVGNQPDLSTAANEVRRLLAMIEADSAAAEVAGLHDPRERLEAHCRAILGN